MTNELLTIIAEIEDAIKARGAKKSGKGNYSEIYSLDQLQKFIREYGKDKVSFRWGQFETHPINEKQVVVKVEALWAYDGKVHTDVVSMPGTDMNNISFAAGKGLTYGKRYYLTGMLGLGSEDLEPDNPEVLKKELVEGINRVFSDNPEKKEQFSQMWKTKYKTELNISKLSVANLQKIARQIGV